jgi:hypothetical protein
MFSKAIIKAETKEPPPGEVKFERAAAEMF